MLPQSQLLREIKICPKFSVHWHLCRLYEGSADFVWNSYAARSICVTAIGAIVIFGVVMKHQVQGDKSSPYSPLSCLLLLLMAGIFLAYKSGAVDHLFY
jgi:hypothetical protein